MENENTKWLQLMRRLKVDKARGNPAPHKPLLLLALLEMPEQNELPIGFLRLTPELAFRFTSYWSIVAHRRTHRPDVRLPFHYLQSDGFWTSCREDGSGSDSPRTTRLAALAPGFENALGDAGFRKNARSILIDRYFEPAERLALREMVGLPAGESDDNRGAVLGAQQSEEERARGRSARFRLDVVTAYQYTCALTGYRLTTVAAGSLVDAAHIHQFAKSGDDDITNGIALSKNAHWAFDAGLWSLADDYTVVVASDDFMEVCPDGRPLSDYHGKPIRLPADRRMWPGPLHLAWHRRIKFIRKDNVV